MEVYIIYKKPSFETNNTPTFFIYKAEDEEKAFAHFKKLGLEYDIISTYIEED